MITPFATPDTLPWNERRHPNPSASAGRTDFEVDKDRIVHCETFRQLQYKTQVQSLDHPADEGFRTRLNHVIEVGQVARGLARAIGADEFLAEGIALGHDLGHPPFGHAGERALRKLLSRAGHPDWNANIHSLAVVDDVERSYVRHHGLNLTWATREGIARHSTPFDEPMTFGEFASSLNAGLECQIVDAADVVAYLSHDLDDALAGEYVLLEQVASLSPSLDALIEKVEAAWLETGSSLWPASEHDTLVRKALVSRLVSIVMSDITQETSFRLDSLDPTDVNAVRHASNRVVSGSEDVETLIQQLLGFLTKHYYRSAEVARMDQGAEQLVYELFDFLLSNSDYVPERFVDDDPALSVAHYLVSLNDHSARRLAVDAGILGRETDRSIPG